MAKGARRTAATQGGPRGDFIVRLDTYEGNDTACYLFGAEPMWVVISVAAAGAAVVDWGYRSVEEARRAWPGAVPPARERRRTRLDRYCLRPVFAEPWFQRFWRKLKRRQAREGADAHTPPPPW